MTLHLTNKVAVIAAGAALGIAVLQGSAQAATLTQWNFNTPVPDANPATGTLIPNIGTGTVMRIGGTTGTFATAEDGGMSSDPRVGDDSALDTTTYPAATALNKTAGVEFKVSTVGQQNVRVNFDQYFSATSSKFSQFQYSSDGTNFVDFGSQVVGSVNTWSNNNMFNLSSILGVNDNANFTFRIVSAFAPGASGYAGTGGTYATDGSWRFDMATVNADAIPTPALLPGLVGMGLGLLRKRKSEVAELSGAEQS
ncbi:PTPA-CTERM sorting domain-containing protein [Leptolyngbya sp. BC1307]|uniref:PTPA-CTERM sorting domain-containing protein n=1 Tax=Leptolyngbya sp. BC1307 TaxID=2029589 RepID=UPI000EFCA3BA|nr:PTPA-CTERM sorting domain-containing protein [Leptolyngbya sp. BC1307]